MSSERVFAKKLDGCFQRFTLYFQFHAGPISPWSEHCSVLRTTDAIQKALSVDTGVDNVDNTISVTPYHPLLHIKEKNNNKKIKLLKTPYKAAIFNMQFLSYQGLNSDIPFDFSTISGVITRCKTYCHFSATSLKLRKQQVRYRC
ncbi:hypothetical protein JOB18_001254 [Solea senegalensis]|uniref:Uncharacterized protein n=1 Tax=Solea senegalensis TaxID=28829 RepID=A0AAV6R850_SOLSE|nr:hypothetical protein JOB18_001254 [Solea senegalensis]